MMNGNVQQGDGIRLQAQSVFLQFSECLTGASGGAPTAPFVATPSNTNIKEKLADDSLEAGSVHKVGQGDPRSEAAGKAPRSIEEIFQIQPVTESSKPSISRFSYDDDFYDNFNVLPVSSVRRSQRDHIPTSGNNTSGNTSTYSP